MNDDFGSSYLERSWEVPEDVILRRELVRTPGLQPEDLGVLAELLLRDPQLPSTMEAIRKDLQARGWKMGKDRYNAIAGRLTKAGHLARISVYDEVAQRPTWVTRVYRNPANNQQYIDLGLTVPLQVSTARRETRDPGPEPLHEPLETRVSPAPRRNAGNPRSGSGWRKTRDLETRVSPAPRWNAGNPRSDVHPPLPPGEEESSPLYPLTTGSLPSQRKEAPEFSLEEIRSAEDFLQQMQQWQAGLVTARKSAPKLLSAMRAQGWPALTAMDDCQRRILEDEVFKNTTGAASWAKCLPLWVADLRRYRAPAPASAPATQPRPAPQDLAGLRAACPACDQYGWAMDGDDDAPMRRCTHPGITAGTLKELG